VWSLYTSSEPSKVLPWTTRLLYSSCHKIGHGSIDYIHSLVAAILFQICTLNSRNEETKYHSGPIWRVLNCAVCSHISAEMTQQKRGCGPKMAIVKNDVKSKVVYKKWLGW